jgi:hypothetical protein
MRLVGWCCLGSSPQNVWEISKFTKENWKLRQSLVLIVQLSGQPRVSQPNDDL